jgi:hypothetical protein
VLAPVLYGIAQEAQLSGHSAARNMMLFGAVRDATPNARSPYLQSDLAANLHFYPAGEEHELELNKLLDGNVFEQDLAAAAVFTVGPQPFVSHSRSLAVLAGVERGRLLSSVYGEQASAVASRASERLPIESYLVKLGRSRLMTRDAQSDQHSLVGAARSAATSYYLKLKTDALLVARYGTLGLEDAVSRELQFWSRLCSGDVVGLEHPLFEVGDPLSESLFDYQEQLFVVCMRGGRLPEAMIRSWSSAREIFRSTLCDAV